MFSVTPNYECGVPFGLANRDSTVLTNWKINLFWVHITHFYGSDDQNSSYIKKDFLDQLCYWPLAKGNSALWSWLTDFVKRFWYRYCTRNAYCAWGCNVSSAAHDDSLLKVDTFISLRIWLNCCLGRIFLLRLHDVTRTYVVSDKLEAKSKNRSLAMIYLRTWSAVTLRYGILTAVRGYVARSQGTN